MELVDVAPTVLDLLGKSEWIEQAGMQGRSLVPLLQGPLPSQRVAYSRTLWNKPRYAARSREHKLIWDSRTGGSELYVLDSDPEERHNRFGEDLLVGGFLRQELYRWLREQEGLRVGKGRSERAVVPGDLRRQLEELGYVHQLEEAKQ